MVNVLLVGLGGLVGSVSRYGVAVLCSRLGASFPWGTLAVNVAGCLAVGALVPFLGGLGERGRLLLVTGFLGGFTTFSALGLETQAMAKEQPGLAALYVAGTLAAGLGAVWLGRAAAAAFR
jgi:CrcB protein